MKIRAFNGMFDIEASPEEFVDMMKKLNKEGISLNGAGHNDAPARKKQGDVPQNLGRRKPMEVSGGEPPVAAVQTELPLDPKLPVCSDGVGTFVMTSKGFRKVHPVDLMNSKGQVVKTYPSVTKAAKEQGYKHPSKISEAIRKKRTYGGYWYRYHEEDAA